MCSTKSRQILLTILCTTWRFRRFCSQEEVLGSLLGNNWGLALVDKVWKLATILQQCVEARRFGGWQSPSLWRYLSSMPRRPTRCFIWGNKYAKPWLEADRSWTNHICRRDPFRVGAAPTERIAVLFPFRSISCLALRCPREFPRIGFGTSIGAGKWWERRSAFQELSEKYLTWCSNNGRTAHIQKLTNEHIGWRSTTCYPPASWHKGDLTALLMLFVQSRFETEGWDGMLHDVGEAAVAINLFVTTMFDRIGCLAWARAGQAGHESWSSIFEALQQNGAGVFGAGAALVDLASKSTRFASPHRAHAGRCRSRACSQRAVHVGSNGRRFISLDVGADCHGTPLQVLLRLLGW